MHIPDLIKKYQKISSLLDARWPIVNKNERVFARTMKVVEELGELTDDILSSMNLQRSSKIEKFSKENLENEFADVIGSLLLLSVELDIDVEKVMQRKVEFTLNRFAEKEQTPEV